MRIVILAICIVALPYLNIFSQWTLVTSAPDVYQQDIVNIDGRLLLSTSGSGIYESDDGGTTWLPKSSGLNSQQAMVVYQVMEHNSMMYAATMDGIYKSTNNGENWVKKSNGITIGPGAAYEFTQSVFEYNDILFTGAWNGIYYSSDGGENWNLTNVSGEAVLAKNFTLYDDILFAAREVNNTPVGYRSSDGGMNWDPLNGLSFFSTITFFSEPLKLWAGTITGVWLSTDDGLSWEDRSNGLSLDPYSSSILRVDGVLITALKFGGSGIYRSFDEGLNWENFSEGLPFLNSIDRVIEYDGMLLAATSEGLWQREISAVPVEMTSFTASAGNNYIELKWKTATEKNNSGFEVQRKSNETDWKKITFIRGNGTTALPAEYSYKDADVSKNRYLYRLKQINFDGSFAYSSVIEFNNNIIEQFSLNQNYPNPFNPATKISFSIGSPSSVSLRVYNSVGQEVAVLISGWRTAGEYSVDFSAGHLASGTYYYELNAGEFNEVRKMILIK